MHFLVSLSRDLRARLELAVDHILEACSRVECLTDTDCTTTASNTSLAASEESSSSHSQPEFLMNSPLVTTIVRRELAVAIRDLMQHGMISVQHTIFNIPIVSVSNGISIHRLEDDHPLFHSWDACQPSRGKIEQAHLLLLPNPLRFTRGTSS